MSESDVVIDQETTEVPVIDESEKVNTEVNDVQVEHKEDETQVEPESNVTNEVQENQSEEIPTQESEVVIENQAEEPKESQPVSEPEIREDTSVVVEESKGSEEVTQPVVSEEVKPEPARELKEYTLEEVAQHDKQEDCWIVINDKVYDVTPFVSTHPGGLAILRNAGKDSTIGFEKIGAHKKKTNVDDVLSKAHGLMPTFLIGTVRQAADTDAKVEVDPEAILAQCLAEAEEKVKVEISSPTTQPRVEPTVKPVVQPTPTVSQPTSVPVQQPTTQSTTTEQPKVTITTKKTQVTPQRTSETSYATWLLVGGGVAIAAVGVYAYLSNKQKI